jgi:hypothetical protein
VNRIFAYLMKYDIFITFMRTFSLLLSFDVLVLKKKVRFCSTLSEFENFLLCERNLINLTPCQNETSNVEPLRGSSNKKNVVFNSFLCKLAHSCQKKANLHTNSLNKLLFC